MNNNNRDSNLRIAGRKPLKKVLTIGPKKVIVLDDELLRELGIDEDKILFQEEIIEQGILLRIVSPP